MFPASKTSQPASFKIFAKIIDVVVLPLVPVTAIIFALVYFDANSISEKI